ncbi:MAG: EamA family transporter RarD, partial [Hyphomicrobiales bacterium]
TESRRGVVYALLAFGLWGFYGLFFAAVAHIDVLEIVAHRAFWSVPFALGVLWALGKLSDVSLVLADRRLMVRLLFTSFFVAVNWSVMVWAVSVDRTLEASLGYYINPLLNVVIGFVLLSERLTWPQVVAVSIAAVAVAVQTLLVGVFPWVALVLAGSFATYGYLRKTMPIGPVQGFLVEALVLSVVGVAIVSWLAWHSDVSFGANTTDTLLLIACGPMTALPLMWFAAAARRIRLGTLGLLQYIAPSGLFLTAILVFGEPLDVWGLATFVLIWVALAIYSAEAFRLDRIAQRQDRARARESDAAAASAMREPAS